jgi:hypothetical protein
MATKTHKNAQKTEVFFCDFLRLFVANWIGAIRGDFRNSITDGTDGGRLPAYPPACRLTLFYRPRAKTIMYTVFTQIVMSKSSE